MSGLGSDTVVTFASLSMQAGDFCTGLREDGARVAAQIDGCRWYVRPLMAIARALRCAWLAQWTVWRGIDMHVVATYEEAR